MAFGHHVWTGTTVKMLEKYNYNTIILLVELVLNAYGNMEKRTKKQ